MLHIFLTLLATLVTIGSCAQLFCPSTAGINKQNVIQQTQASIPPTLTYEFSSLQRNGNEITELSVRVDGQRVYLEVLKKNLAIVQQYKDFTTSFKIIAVKNELVIVKVYSADNTTFSYSIMKFNSTLAIYKSSAPVSFQIVLSMIKDDNDNSISDLQIQTILNYKQFDQQLYMVLASQAQAYVYYLLLDTKQFLRVRAIQSHLLPKILGGSRNMIYDDTTDMFFSLYQSSYLAVSISTIVGTKGFYPSNVQVASLQRDNIGYFSAQPETKKATLIVATTFGNWVEAFATGNQEVTFYHDGLSNIIAYSDLKLVWFNVQFYPQNALNTLKFSKERSGSNPLTINQAIDDFSTCVTVSTSDTWAFVLAAAKIQYYNITTASNAATVEKVQEVTLSDGIQTSLSADANKIVVLSLKCMCADLARGPKLVCFSGDLNCFAITSKKYKDCTSSTI